MSCRSKSEMPSRNRRCSAVSVVLGTWIVLSTCWVGRVVAAPVPGLDLRLAASYFAEAREISDREGGETWGRPLYGPMLLVDRATRAIVANRPDERGELRRENDLFVGRLPDEVNCANTATDWGGVHWTMLIWPLPEDRWQRARLMMHESFHRIQREIGLPMASPDNPQLDTREGRIWLQLEWRALHRALERDGETGSEIRRQAVRDALGFRERRHRLFAGAAADERALELNEGLAEYTGVRAAYPADGRAEQARLALEVGPGWQTLMRSFAYASGPAYGLLLDEAEPGWRSNLDQRADLGALLAQAWKIDLEPQTDAELSRAVGRYDGRSLIEREDERERARQVQVELDRSRLWNGPILILSLSSDVSYSFNPGNLRSLGDAGTVYPTLRVTDRWGTLDVDGGALMTREEGRASTVHVTAPETTSPGREIRGDGWTLTLNPGWSLEAADRAGDYRLRSGQD